MVLLNVLARCLFVRHLDIFAANKWNIRNITPLNTILAGGKTDGRCIHIFIAAHTFNTDILNT